MFSELAGKLVRIYEQKSGVLTAQRGERET